MQRTLIINNIMQEASIKKEANQDFNIDINNILTCLIEFFDGYENDDEVDAVSYLINDLYNYKADIEKYHEITMNNIV